MLIRPSRCATAGAAAIALWLAATGCTPPRGRLTFPEQPLRQDEHCTWYDGRGTGVADFGLARDTSGRIARLYYDDDHDGRPDRVYDLPDEPGPGVPHAIILLDSIPFAAVRHRYEAGEFRYFQPPQKVIPPFPSLTEICYTSFFHAPPLPGMVDEHFDRQRNQRVGDLWQRLNGAMEPWEQRLDYRATYWEASLSYLRPAAWYEAEIDRARLAIEHSRSAVPLVYTVSASGLVCRHGEPGLELALQELDRLCLQLLYETHGQIVISVLADHGHNLMHSRNVDFAPALQAAGFHPADAIASDRDVVVERTGLVTYVGMHTRRPAEVAAVVVRQKEVELVAYQDPSADRIVIASAAGNAVIERRAGRFRYRSIEADPLQYGPVLANLKAAGKMDPDGFVADADFFAATVDQLYPDAPRRLWDAFHGLVNNTPDVMATLKDGYCCGLPDLEEFITMASTHGGLNQVNSATFVMSTSRHVTGPLRTSALLRTLAPGFTPTVHHR